MSLILTAIARTGESEDGAIPQHDRQRLSGAFVEGAPNPRLRKIIREIGQPIPPQWAPEATTYLRENWSDDIRDRVMDIITRNIEL
jgi:hypothetical protein